MATLLQTFIIDHDSSNAGTGFLGYPDTGGTGVPADGRFITSLDLFFSDKDSNLPVTVEIRNVINGYPGAKILPFGRVSVD